jgi:hypothetical protein
MDIVLTIPKSEYKHDDLETKYLKENKDAFQFWTLSRKPTKLNIGDRVYFVKNNKIDSSMEVFNIKKHSTIKCEVTDRVWSGEYQIFMNDLREENLDFEVKGFQGFRYRWW